MGDYHLRQKTNLRLLYRLPDKDGRTKRRGIWNCYKLSSQNIDEGKLYIVASSVNTVRTFPKIKSVQFYPHLSDHSTYFFLFFIFRVFSGRCCYNPKVQNEGEIWKFLSLFAWHCHKLTVRGKRIGVCLGYHS